MRIVCYYYLLIIFIIGLTVYEHNEQDMGNKCPADTEKARENVASTSNAGVISPKVIRPFPKRTKKIMRRRKGLASEIITTSPYKKKKTEEIAIQMEKVRRKSARKLKKVDRNLFLEEDNDPELSDFHADDNDDEQPCIYCNEIFRNSRPNEKWIQCMIPDCRKWAHIECAGVDYFVKDFVCDLCK